MARHTNSYASSKSKNRTRRYTVEWTLELSVALIQAVKRAEYLWDPSNTYYKERSVKNDSWEKIAKTIGVSKPQAILRWSAMRGNYLAFLKKDKYSSAQAEKKHRRSHPLYSEMKFLDPVIDPESKLCYSNVKQSPSPANVSSTESEYCESNDSPQRPSTPKQEPALSPASPTQLNLSQSHARQTQVTRQCTENPTEERTAMKSMMMSAYDLLMQNTERNDEWDAFGNMIASNARSWSKENMGFARRYKAALSAVNAKFDMEAAEMSVGDEFVVT